MLRKANFERKRPIFRVKKFWPNRGLWRTQSRSASLLLLEISCLWHDPPDHHHRYVIFTWHLKWSGLYLLRRNHPRFPGGKHTNTIWRRRCMFRHVCCRKKKEKWSHILTEKRAQVPFVCHECRSVRHQETYHASGTQSSIPGKEGRWSFRGNSS